MHLLIFLPKASSTHWLRRLRCANTWERRVPFPQFLEDYSSEKHNNPFLRLLLTRLARFFWYNTPKRENIPNNLKIPIILNGQIIYQLLPLQDPPKLTQIGIFGFKICHLATLLLTFCFLKNKRKSFFGFLCRSKLCIYYCVHT
jgi:hypothetical protein